VEYTSVRFRPANDEAGQVVPLMALVVMLVVVSLLILVRLGTTLDDAARARTAADAAALAGAVDGRAGAVDMATANGGELVSFDIGGGEADVEVRVGDATAAARAKATIVEP